MREEKNVFTPLYLTRFQCTGSQCEDTCCQGWSVYIDPAHLQNIKSLMPGEAAFNEKIELMTDKSSALQGYGKVRLNAEKQCHFLNEGLCELQQCHGEQLLPDVCANYPRNQLFTGQQVHMSGVLSCPEMARLCLLPADAMQLLESKQTVYAIYNAKISATEPSYYERYIDDNRLLWNELLSLPNYSLRQKLALIAGFSLISTGYFYKAVENDPSEALQLLIAAMQQQEYQTELLASVAGLSISSSLPMKLVLVVLARVEQTDLIQQLLKSTAGMDTEQPNISLTLEQIYAAYKVREQAVTESYPAAIEQYFTYYCKNYYFGESYTQSENLVVYTQALLIRVACLRFMFFSHPRIITLLENDALAGQQALLDSVAVEVFYRFSRLYEHNAALMQELEKQMLEEGEAMSLLLALIEF